MYLILADSGIELIPKNLWTHPAVRNTALRRGKEPGKLLLDISLHYSAMKTLRDYEKRGRPDIVHVCLLMALSSLLNIKGYLKVYVHTYDSKIIEIDPLTRIPRNYNRFIGLMEQLLISRSVPPGSQKHLLKILPFNLKELIERLSPSKITILDEKGGLRSPRKLAKALLAQRNPLVIIGAFQKGEFSEEIRSLNGERIAISKVRLDSWSVVSKVISSVEDELGLYEVDP